MDAAQKFFKGLFFRGLFVFIPVHIGQAPEKGLISHILCHLQIAFTVFSLRGAVVPLHFLSSGLFIEGFQIGQLLLEGFFAGNF